ncbi:MAG: pantoate--beta-alanine ligase [Candidatus Omnitrophica bacterium]|nr:pantoate--beta-alanine ligase [Candidatus Omnitrophota bacterium]
MKIIKKVDKMKTYAKIMKKENKLIGFIPTMGYLHEGHLSLMRTARKQTDTVITSIFVNPLQFGPDEDFKKYPRNIKKDEELARQCGVDVMFYPENEDMYPEGFATYINVEGLTEGLCGKSRAGHFRGVTTVVMKLFEIVKPDIAYFGQKDAQQAFVIKKMIEDLRMDITMKIMPIAREESGLAMSSRNAYLTKPEKKEAGILFTSLKLAEESVNSGEKDPKKIIKKMRDSISASSASAKIDYISIVDTKSLKEVRDISGEVLIALAVFIGKTRLIDNIIINTEKSEEGYKNVGTPKERNTVQGRA